MIDRYQWMDLQDVLHATSAMDKNRVSEVARGIKDSTQTKEGFVEAYIATKGDKNKMSKRKTGRKKKGIEVETWSDRRNQFISRHLKQMRQSDTYSDGWLPNGEPTDRHLGLIAWAYTPSPKRTKKWLESQPKLWKQYVSNPSRISKQELADFRLKRKLLKKHKESLGIKKYSGDLHNNDHQTGFFEGYIDPQKAVDIFGFNQEHNKWDFKKGSCRGKGRYTQERWEELADDVKKNGIKNPIQIVVEYTKSLGIYQAFIWEGNHRARLACQLNIPLPVEVKYFGRAESQDMDSLTEYLSKDPIISKQIRSAIHLINKDGVNEKIGYVTFSDSAFGLKIETDIANLPDGEHGFHIHEYGNLEPKLKDGNWVAGLSAGMHYDPYNTDRHGSPYNDGKWTRYDTHLGDLPFITVKNGITRQVLYAPRLKLNEIIDRSIIIHELGDNYSDYPLPNGGGKSRIAGGVITNNCIYCNIKNNPFNAKALERILYQSYKRGVGAWKSGHRKFQSPQSWGNARVNSFLVGGRTFFSSDNDLAMKLPQDLYDAIVKQRVDVPIPKYDEKVVRDYKGNLIQEKYLDGYEGKAREKRIKEINQRRKEYEDTIKKYKTESKIPIRIKQKLYRGWKTDKGESKKKSPYTKVAHKRGFTGSRMNKAKQALKYYLEPIKNPMTKEQFINQKIKWKRGKDFEFDGEYVATIDGKEYDLYRDNTSGMSSYPTWHGSDKTNKILGYDRKKILGYTKKEAVKKLLTDIWNKKKSEDYVFDVERIPYSSFVYAIEDTNDEYFSSKEELEQSFLSNYLGKIQDAITAEYNRIYYEIQKYADITKLEMINTSRWRESQGDEHHIDLFFTPFTVVEWDGKYKVFKNAHNEIWSTDYLIDAKRFTIDYAYDNRKDLLKEVDPYKLVKNYFGEYLLSADKEIWNDIKRASYDEWIESELENHKDEVLKYAYENGLNPIKEDIVFSKQERIIIENLSKRFSYLVDDEDTSVFKMISLKDIEDVIVKREEDVIVNGEEIVNVSTYFNTYSWQRKLLNDINEITNDYQFQGVDAGQEYSRGELKEYFPNLFEYYEIRQEEYSVIGGTYYTSRKILGGIQYNDIIPMDKPIKGKRKSFLVVLSISFQSTDRFTSNIYAELNIDIQTLVSLDEDRPHKQIASVSVRQRIDENLSILSNWENGNVNKSFEVATTKLLIDYERAIYSRWKNVS